MIQKFTFNNEEWKEFFNVASSGTPFFVNSTFIYDNLPTLRSGQIGHSGTSQTTLTFTLKKVGYIKFTYTVSSERNYDKFSVIIDGATVVNNASGSIGWTEVKRDLDKGVHTLVLRYTKDGSVSSGSDAGAIGYLEVDGAESIIFDWDTQISNPLEDNFFLRELDKQNLQNYYAKILVLDFQEKPMQEITGYITAGSININGDSSLRRTCNLTFLANEYENDLTNINNILSINKKIKIFVGMENSIESQYDKIIWFPQGVYVICQPNITKSLNGLLISLSCKDKMCLLNGECGGSLPAPITFDSYDQLNPDGSVTSIPQVMYDIIQTLVCNYGGEDINKIFISEVAREIKQIVRYVGSIPLYYNTKNHVYTTNKNNILTDIDNWIMFEYNENIGYVYTDFIYPGELRSGIGDNVCSILDKIKNALGNYEYFYDINGNFIFREIKNYLNNAYDPTDIYRLDNNRRVEIENNNLNIINNANYQVDFYSNNKFIY